MSLVVDMHLREMGGAGAEMLAGEEDVAAVQDLEDNLRRFGSRAPRPS